MRGRRRAALLIAIVALLASETSARASALVFELGVRAGYVFGRGWTLGPVASFVRAGIPSNWFIRNNTLGLAGLTASVDVVLPSDAPLEQIEWRFHAGPELGAVHACRAFGGVVDAGVLWSYRRGAPIQFGVEGGATPIAALFVPSFGEGDGPIFAGLAYRYGELIGGEGAQEVALDVRGWMMPLNPGNWGTLCSVFTPSRRAFAD